MVALGFQGIIETAFRITTFDGGFLMDVSCLQYGLTDEERSMFDEKGYFVVENALSPEHVARLTAKVDGIHEQRLKEGFEPDKGMFFSKFHSRR